MHLSAKRVCRISNISPGYPRWIIFRRREKCAENTRAQPGRAFFVPLRRTKISHTFACTTRALHAGGPRVREREARATTRETFLSIGGRPARLGSALRGGARGVSHVVLACRYRYRALALSVVVVVERASERTNERRFVVAGALIRRLSPRRDTRRPWAFA